ncbi:invasion associated locus B family protein [Pararhodobacter oceanensis]|uniref:invasion associated locus B family protein n=1 Tax=Pararhodobacter oceanensis TaxID=2172121 RepID=UPI003A908F11
MTFRSALPSAVFCLALSAMPALAQEAEADAEAQAPQPGQPYSVSTHNDWEVVCSIVDEAGTEACELYQLLLDESETPIAEISVSALPFGSEFAAGITATTPLETFLPTGMGWRIGNAEEMRIEPFRVCTVVGCVVRMGMTAEEVDAMKAGATATVTIAPFVAIDQPIEISVSLSGFTAGYEALQTRMSEAAVRQREN